MSEEIKHAEMKFGTAVDIEICMHECCDDADDVIEVFKSYQKKMLKRIDHLSKIIQILKQYNIFNVEIIPIYDGDYDDGINISGPVEIINKLIEQGLVYSSSKVED